MADSGRCYFMPGLCNGNPAIGLITEIVYKQNGERSEP